MLTWQTFQRFQRNRKSSQWKVGIHDAIRHHKRTHGVHFWPTCAVFTRTQNHFVEVCWHADQVGWLSCRISRLKCCYALKSARTSLQLTVNWHIDPSMGGHFVIQGQDASICTKEAWFQIMWGPCNSGAIGFTNGIKTYQWQDGAAEALDGQLQEGKAVLSLCRHHHTYTWVTLQMLQILPSNPCTSSVDTRCPSSLYENRLYLHASLCPLEPELRLTMTITTNDWELQLENISKSCMSFPHDACNAAKRLDRRGTVGRAGVETDSRWLILMILPSSQIKTNSFWSSLNFPLDDCSFSD